MDTRIDDLGAMEAQAYRSTFDDGLLDIFIALSLVGIGLLWLTDLAGLGGIVPVLLIPFWPLLRRRITEPRIGQVTWAPRRQATERKGLFTLLLLGVLLLGAGITVFFYVRGSGGLDAVLRTWVPGLPAALVALGLGLGGLLFGLRRLGGYAGVLLVAAAITVFFRLDPVHGLALAGGAVLILGCRVLWQFLRSNPIEATGDRA